MNKGNDALKVALGIMTGVFDQIMSSEKIDGAISIAVKKLESDFVGIDLDLERKDDKEVS